MPGCCKRSLEGSILARLLAIPSLQLVGARMIAPSDAMVDAYLSSMRNNATDGPWKDAMLRFVEHELLEKHNVERGYPNRLMLLLFKGSLPTLAQSLN